MAVSPLPAAVEPSPAPAGSDCSGGGGIWRDARIAEAISLFESGRYSASKSEALSAVYVPTRPPTGEAGALGAGGSDAAALAHASDRTAEPVGWPSQQAPRPQKNDNWREALDNLATAHEELGDADHAEALYLRMLAWREGTEQYRMGSFKVAEQLFKRSPSYSTVEDATWFLQSMRQDDQHAAAQVVGLLALGEEVAAKAAVAVWTLALRKEQRAKLSECGAVELVSKAVAYHIENPELQAAGCGALRLLCSGHRLAERNRQLLVGRLGGVEALAAALRCHPSDPEVQREGCGALRAIASRYPAGARRILLENGGVALCLGAIAECPEDESVGEAACRTLDALLSNASEAGPRAGDAAAEDMRAVVDGRLRGEREAGLRFCEERLMKLLPPPPPQVSPPAEKQASQMNSTSLSSTGFAQHRRQHQSEMAQLKEEGEEGVEDLGLQLAFLPERESCGPVSAAGASCSQERRGPALTTLLRAAFVLLDDEGVRHRSLKLIGPTVACMQAYPGHTKLQIAACGVLYNLTTGHLAKEEAAARVASSGAITAVCQAMRDLPCNPDVQRLAAGVLMNATKVSHEYKTLGVKAGGINFTVLAMRRFPKDAVLQERAICALTNLCDTVGRSATCARFGGVEEVVGAIRRHAASAGGAGGGSGAAAGGGRVAEVGCLLLCMFCDDAALRQHVAAAGAAPVAHALSRSGPVAVQRWAHELLQELAESGCAVATNSIASHKAGSPKSG